MKSIHKVLLVALIMLTACEEKTIDPPAPDPIPEEKGLYLIMHHTFDGQSINYGSVEYPTNRNTVGVSNLSYYLSGFQLQKQDGSWHNVEVPHLFVAQSKPVDTVFLGELPEGNYQALRFALGLDSAINHSDPAQWSNDHPLSLMRGGQMHWSWNAGYIFLKLEGRYRKSATEVGFYSYHIGRDDLIVPYVINGLNVQGGARRANLSLEFNVANFFNTPHEHILADSSFFTHSSYGDSLAEVLHGNMFQLIKIKP